MTIASIQSEAELEDKLSEPSSAVVEALRRLEGDILFLGIAGKMGPSLARMARRAAAAAGRPRRIIGVARFSSGPAARAALEDAGIETISADLLQDGAIDRLPDAPNVVFMAGRKFGSTGDEAQTWAMNTYLPGLICRRYPASRMLLFSTGNVYGLSSVARGGSLETDEPRPLGEYAMSCLGRERMCEYFSCSDGLRAVILRVNYACDLRYGVLVDLAGNILRGEPVDLAMGHFNTLWQGDANAMTLRAFEHAQSPPLVLNLTGTETLSVRGVCERLAERLGKTPRFVGTESASALLSNAAQAHHLLGPARVSADELIEAVAHWVSAGSPTLGKPTHFESREGKF